MSNNPINDLARSLATNPGLTPVVQAPPLAAALATVAQINADGSFIVVLNGGNVPVVALSDEAFQPGQSVLTFSIGTQIWALGIHGYQTPAFKAISPFGVTQETNANVLINISTPLIATGGMILGGAYDCVVPVSGIYRASGIVMWNEISGANSVAISSIHQNGMPTEQASVFLGGVPQILGVAVTTLLSCSAGDRITLWAYQNTNAFQTPLNGSSLSVEYVGTNL